MKKQLHWIPEPLSRYKVISVVAVINILLSAVALFKDIFLASYLGTSANADAFSLAFFIPDMSSNVLLSTAVGIGCVPLFTNLLHQKKQIALRDVFMAINLLISGIAAVLTLLIWLFREPLITLVGSGFSADTKTTCVNLLTIMLPTILLYPLAAVGMAILQVRGRFASCSFAPVLFNFVFFVSIAGCSLLKVPVATGIYVLSYAVLITEIVVVIYVFAWVKASSGTEERFVFSKAELQMVWKSFKDAYGALRLTFYYILILLLTQAVMYVERFLSSQYGAGSLSALNYAYRISQFPVWVFASAVMMVAFPQISKHAEAAPEKAAAILQKSFFYILILNLPIMIALYVLREPIISILFQRGSFSAHSAQITSGILAGYSLAILGQSFFAVMNRFVIAANQAKSAVAIYFVCSVINIFADFAFVRTWGIYSIGYGTALASVIGSVALIARYKLGHSIQKGFKSLGKVLVSNLMVFALCESCAALWIFTLHNAPFLTKLTFAFCSALVITLLYIVSLKILKIDK